VAALEEAETLSIHQIDFAALRDRTPTVDRFLVGLLTAQVRRLSGQLVEALYLPADTRVRRRLLDVMAAFGPVQPGTVVPLTQEELASLAGTSRATVNKVLREEQAAGTIELARGRTTLLDPEALERKARPFA
jgi:CRP-like cAMP-binding protein